MLYIMPLQVDFSDEERLRRAATVGTGTARGLTGWFIRHKFAADERQASQVLVLVFVGVLVVIAIVAWRAFGAA